MYITPETPIVLLVVFRVVCDAMLLILLSLAIKSVGRASACCGKSSAVLSLRLYEIDSTVLGEITTTK